MADAADSQTVEDAIKWFLAHQAVIRIRGEDGQPGKVVVTDAIHVTVNVVDFRNSLLHKTQLNAPDSIFILSKDGQPVLSNAGALDSLSSDVLQAASYTRFTGNGALLESLTQRFQQNHKTTTYPGGKVEILGKKEVQEKAPELIEEQIVAATQATAAPINIATIKPLDIPKLEPHKIDENLIHHIDLVEPTSEPLTFEGGVSAVLKIGDIAHSASNHQRAMHYYLQYLREIPTSEQIWQRIGDITTKNPSFASGWLSEIKNVAPFTPDVWLRKAQVAEKAGVPNFAFDFYYQALLKRTSLPVWPNLRTALAHFDERTKLQNLSLLEKIEPASPDMWKRRADVAEGIGVPRKSIEYYEQAFRLNPQDDATLAKLKELLKPYHG